MIIRELHLQLYVKGKVHERAPKPGARLLQYILTLQGVQLFPHLSARPTTIPLIEDKC
jgi:hypothetical protein